MRQAGEGSSGLLPRDGGRSVVQGAFKLQVTPISTSRAEAKGSALASPVSVMSLLGSGGDGRIAVDAGTGLNRYGCGPQPDPAIAAFGSSTASTISTAAFAAVERLAARLSEALAEGAAPADLYRRGAGSHPRQADLPSSACRT